jgi:uncharacterized protein (DUF1330 family)
MSYYLLVGIDVHDLDTYNQYFERAMPSLDKYGVEFIAYSDTPVALEEANPFERYAVVKFKDRATFEQWYRSIRTLFLSGTRQPRRGCLSASTAESDVAAVFVSLSVDHC